MTALSAAERAAEDARRLAVTSDYRELASARSALEQLLRDWARRPPGTGESEVAALWVLYAQLERDLRQFGRATGVFERAVACRVAGREPLVWAEYARFCAERGRLANARKVFKRGLKALQGERREALLRSFHAFTADFMGVALPLDAFRRCVFPAKRGGELEDADPTSRGFHQVWVAAIEQLELPSPAAGSTVSSASDSARLEGGGSAGCCLSADDPATSDDQDEARPAAATTTRSGRVSVPKRPFEGGRSAAERERLRLRAERRREQVECAFCRQLFSRASTRSHSIRCKLKLGVAMSAEDRRVAFSFLDKERRKRKRTYRNRKARERATSSLPADAQGA